MIHKGRAYTYLKQFDKALDEFDKVKILDSKQVKIVNEYIKELERCRLADNQKKAVKVFLTNNQNKNEKNDLDDFLNIINKINDKNQSNLYYSGGIRCLTTLCNNGLKKKQNYHFFKLLILSYYIFFNMIIENKQTLFRTENGFKIFENHHVISK